MPQDLYEKIVSQRGTMGKIGEKIPGYRGYMEAQARREADRMLRDYVAQQFQHQLERLPGIEKIMLNQGGIEWIDDTANLKTLMQTFIGKIETAARGYSGLFSNIKVDGEALKKLYAFDEAMLDYVDDFAAKLDGLETAIMNNEGTGKAIMELDKLTREATQAFDMRSQVMLGVAEEEPPSFFESL
ncbi:MAG: hypothetical protein JXB47_08140 [Anaerolineae bacterium]|nr:hypothetical protein [Anaerolineae bacterium]